MSTSQANPLAQLRDIQLPDAIGWWPLAPGWWMLLGLLVSLGLLSWLSYRWYRRGAIKRAALAELEQIAEQFQGQALLQQLSQLLRRVALASQPRQQVAGLRGQAWLQFLDRFVEPQEFSQGIGSIFATGPYQASKLEIDEAALINLSRRCTIALFKGGRHV